MARWEGGTGVWKGVWGDRSVREREVGVEISFPGECPIVRTLSFHGSSWFEVASKFGFVRKRSQKAAMQAYRILVASMSREGVHAAAKTSASMWVSSSSSISAYFTGFLRLPSQEPF